MIENANNCSSVLLAGSEALIIMVSEKLCILNFVSSNNEWNEILIQENINQPFSLQFYIVTVNVRFAMEQEHLEKEMIWKKRSGLMPIRFCLFKIDYELVKN